MIKKNRKKNDNMTTNIRANVKKSYGHTNVEKLHTRFISILCHMDILTLIALNIKYALLLALKSIFLSFIIEKNHCIRAIVLYKIHKTKT